MEGFGICHHPLAKQPPIVIQHAWNALDGETLDATWDAPGKWTAPERVIGYGYFGVEFSVGRADYAIWTNDACVLVDPDHGYPILRESWKGENASLQWETSPLLRLLRAGASPAQIRDWIVDWETAGGK